MKKLILGAASLFLLASCGGQSSAPQASSAPSPDASPSASVAKNVLTFLADKEIYVDLNFDAKPEGLSVKIGEKAFTESGKATMAKDFAYEIAGTFDKKTNIYCVIDAGGAVSASKSEGVDADAFQRIAERYLKNFSEKQYDYRVYFCLSDKASGWSKTLAGVDYAMKTYAVA